MSVHVTIDELVLIGVDRGDRDAVAAAIERAIIDQLDIASLRHRATYSTNVLMVTSHADLRRGSTPRQEGREGLTSAAPSAVGTRVGSVVARVIDGRQR